MPVMRIAVANIRFPPTPEDTVLLASQAIRQAGIEGADIICFPEAYVSGYRVIEPSMGPELRAQALFRDRLVGAVQHSHPLAGGQITAESYREALHVIVSRSGFDEDAVERPFLPEGLCRRIGCAVSGFAAALALARHSDMVATVPETHTVALREGMFSFPLPVPATGFTVSMVWHPRLDADPVHRWLRVCLRSVCANATTA
jgi:DNA-binding transcriptional LysR family regulator